AQVYRDKLIGVILSGANRDGAYGLKKIKDLGGLAIVQDPNECQVRTMTEASLKMTPVDHVYNTSEIIRFLQTIKT
ncbi:MAG TPA: chemotaxis protein CheB, partial [Tenuifilaceae bacterium]|nr:chemotaxis protein CheB [Tenuifilaceae bacterium]